MTSRIAVLAIDARDPHVLADFWCHVLGWAITEESDGVVSIGPAATGVSTGSGIDNGNDTGIGIGIDFPPVPEAKTVKNRLHLDLRADGSTQAEEVERLIGLGARRVDVGQSADASWEVLADPEGNEFCILARSVQDVLRG